MRMGITSMKKLLIIAFSLCMVTAMFSCKKLEDSTSNTSQTKNTTNPKGKVLIVYFSRTGENYSVGHISIGNTAKIAGYIKDYTGGDTFEIIPAVPYPEGYEKMKEVSQQETASNARPAIKNTLENIDEYSIVFIGSPIWYGAPPLIMRTFYDTYKEKLVDKIIIPFGTHEGSGISSCTSLLKEYFPKATFREALGIRGQQVNNSRDKVNEWLKNIGITKKDN